MRCGGPAINQSNKAFLYQRNLFLIIIFQFNWHYQFSIFNFFIHFDCPSYLGENIPFFRSSNILMILRKRVETALVSRSNFDEFHFLFNLFFRNFFRKKNCFSCEILQKSDKQIGFFFEIDYCSSRCEINKPQSTQ